MSERVCLGKIVGIHGVHGVLRVKSYTSDPCDIAAYGALSNERGDQSFSVYIKGQLKGVLLVEMEGVENRTAAEALKGTLLFAPRDALPPTGQDEYYYVDLIGLLALTPDGDEFGTVCSIHDYGAGDIVEIQPTEGPSILLPFTREHIPAVEIDDGHIILVPPARHEKHTAPRRRTRDK